MHLLDVFYVVYEENSVSGNENQPRLFPEIEVQFLGHHFQVG